jgi:tetratricopeptide (TPR) repeat protein
MIWASRGLTPDADGYRLPTDAEWEYIYRAGTTTLFPVGAQSDVLLSYANVKLMRTLPGGSRLPNSWGLFDTAGNVWEMCWDVYTLEPQGLAVDPTCPLDGPRRVMRGGAFGAGPYYARSALRYVHLADYRNDEGSTGFRVVCPTGPADPVVVRKLLAQAEREAADLAKQPANRGEVLLIWNGLALWHLQAGDWAAAAADLEQMIADPASSFELRCRTAPLRAYVGDKAAHRRCCKQLLDSFKKNMTPRNAERTAKACLLLPGCHEKEAARLAVYAVRQGSQLSPREYFLLALALADYRTGKPAQAEKLLVPIANDSHMVMWNLTIPARFLLAMAQHKQGKAAEAQKTLAAAVRYLEKHLPASPDLAGEWHDWFFCQVLRREAESVMSCKGTD